MDKWFNALIHLEQYGNAGKCPYCKSSNTQFGYASVKRNPQRGYGAVWCEDCKHAISLDRVDMTMVKDKGKPIPLDLIYK